MVLSGANQSGTDDCGTHDLMGSAALRDGKA